MQAAQVGLQGAPPIVAVHPGNPEALKYGRLWERPEYRIIAPGETFAHIFLEHACPKAGSEVIDFGCGTGRGALLLALLGTLRVTMVDFVRNCLDPGVRDAMQNPANGDRLLFRKLDLEQPLPLVAQYGYCTDVLEHIPPDRLDRVLDNILKSAQHVFFSIATFPDHCGALIGEPLHLSVHPYGWWLEQFSKRGAVIHWSEERERHAFFYLTAWTNGEEIVKSGFLNVEEQQIRDNVTHNIAQGWQQAMPHPTNDLECMIVGGGPSLAQYEPEIRQQRAVGVKLITLNGAYNWCLERGLVPSAQIIVDARAFNARFTKPVVEGCKYLLASQCHPSVFEGLPIDRTYLWHASPTHIRDLLDAQYPIWTSIPGGSTVLLRAIPLMRMLGYAKFHLYGCDSCVSGPQHHAYEQPENNAGVVLPVMLSDGRIFYGHPWMIAQAHEFMGLIQKLGDTFDLEIHGDGLLRHILDTGAKFATEGEN